jgi:hypothetical protein
MNRFWRPSSAAALSCALSLPCFAAAPETPPQSGTFDLFTAAEATAWNIKRPGSERSVQRSLGAPGEVTCHSLPAPAASPAANPQIKILAPKLDQPLNAPIDIAVQFIPAGATAIRPDTFRVCYVGFLTMDITQRITDRVTVSPTGIKVSGAQLPSGHHHLLMLIADQDGRYGRQEVTFDIK